MLGALAFLHLYFSTLTAQLGDGLYMAEHANAFTTACTAENKTSEECKRWTYFANASFGYGQQADSDSHLANGMTGFTGRVTDDLTLGIAATTAHATDALGGGSESSTATTGGTLMAAYAPKTGFRLYAAGTVQKLDLDTTRYYDAGAGLERADGNTDATAYGAAARIGWAYTVSDRNTFMPFAEYRWSSAKIGAFNETGGSAPASFADNDISTSQLRLGISDSHKVHDDLILTGSLAVGARIDNGRNKFADTSLNMIDDQGRDAGHRSWGEVSLAADWRVSDGIVLQGRITGHTAETADPDMTGNLGAALSF